MGILAEAERLEIKNKAPVVLCELLFNDKMFKEKQINKYAKLLLRFTHENPKGQKYLIGGIEKTVESFEAALLPKVPHIFKELFEEDVLEEEVILEWAKKVSKKNVSKELAQKIHDKAAPFIKWLLSLTVSSRLSMTTVLRSPSSRKFLTNLLPT